MYLIKYAKETFRLLCVHGIRWHICGKTSQMIQASLSEAMLHTGLVRICHGACDVIDGSESGDGVLNILTAAGAGDISSHQYELV